MSRARTCLGVWLITTVLLFFSHLSNVAASIPQASQSGYASTLSLHSQHIADDQHLNAALNYQRVFDYQHNLTLGQQQRSLVSIGAALRLRQMLVDLQSGKNISVGILGGSVSWGFYMNRGVNDWFALFATWLQEAFPTAKVASKNGCVPATTAEYASMCLEKFVDTNNVDLVFLEYSLNDGYVDTSVRTEHAMAYERLIRKLMQLPKRPAVVLMQVLPQAIGASDNPLFWWTVQDHYGVLASYYQLPWLSMRDAMWHEVVAEAPGFTIPEIYPAQEQDMQRHPSELGHKYMADAAVAMMQQVYMDMLLQPMPLDDDLAQKLLQVPEPMFSDNYESSNVGCFIGDSLRSVVTASEGWTWRNDGTVDKPKWGYSTSTVGAALRIQLDTRMAAVSKADVGTSAAKGPARYQTAGTDADSKSQGISSGSGSSSKSTASTAAAADSSTSELTAEGARPGQEPFIDSSNQAADLPAAQAGRHLHADLKQSHDAALQRSSPGQPLPHHPHPQALSTDTNPGLLRQLQQEGPHSDAWWEAQQAQEEQSERVKLEASNRGWLSGNMLVWVGYTKTWRGAGRAVMSCAGGCSCRNVTVDGHHTWQTTQSFMAKLYTQQAADCMIEVSVLPKSSSNGTYFKVSAVMVTRLISTYDNGDFTDVLLLNAMEGEEFKQKLDG